MAHARIAPRTHRDPPGAGVGAAGQPTSPHAPRSTSMPHARIAPHTHRRLSNQPQRRLVSRQAAVRLVCACWRGHDTRSVCIAPVLSRCTAPHRVLYSPSGALLSGRAAPCRTLLPIGCSSVQVYCFPSGTLPPIGHSAPRRRTAPCWVQRSPSGVLPTIGRAAPCRTLLPIGCSSVRVLCPPSGALPLVGALPPVGFNAPHQVYYPRASH